MHELRSGCAATASGTPPAGNVKKVRTPTTEYPEAVKRWTLEDWETVERVATADLRMLEMIQLQVEQGLLPPDAVARLGYNWGPILSSPAMACMWPELRTQVGSSVRKLIEDSTPAADRVPCQVDLQALRDETILGRKRDTTGAK